jgi:hypothetical protein
MLNADHLKTLPEVPDPISSRSNATKLEGIHVQVIEDIRNFPRHP